MSAPLLTVVTIVRDDLAGLTRTRESVAVQDLAGLQHVVVDGCSSDGSLEAAQSWAAAGDVDLVTGSDQGIYAAMNDGLAAARGEWTTFVNAGDWMLGPNAASTALAHLSRSEACWGYGPCRTVGAQGQDRGLLGDRPFSAGAHLAGRHGPPLPSAYLRTSLLRDLGGFDERWTISADWHLLAKAGLAFAPCQWPEVLVAFDDGGVSSQRYRDTWLQSHQVRSELLGLSTPLRALSRASVEVKAGRIAVLRRAGRVKRAVLGSRPRP